MILVTGATGLNGKELVRQLSARGIALRALVRSAAKAAELSSLPNVEIVVGDMAHAQTLPGALRGVDRAMLISSSEPAMLDIQSNFIAAAASAGVAHVVKLSGIMPELVSPFRFARMHGEIEKRLEASGMAFTHLRAGEFMPSYFRQVPSIVAKGALFLPMEDAKIASIDIRDIAEVAATVLTNPGHEGKTYPLTGPEALSMTEVAEKLSAVTGKKSNTSMSPPMRRRQPSSRQGCRHTSPMLWLSSSPNGATVKSPKFHPWCGRYSGDNQRASISLQSATPRSSAVNSRNRRI